MGGCRAAETGPSEQRKSSDSGRELSDGFLGSNVAGRLITLQELKSLVD